MIATSIESEKSCQYSRLSSFVDHITIFLHYCSIELKSFILNIIAISMISTIVTVFVVFTFGRNLQLDASGLAMLALSIKNAMSVAAVTYATHCAINMAMGMLCPKR